ncbi:hypothetical protein BJY01DRAFT_96871 [Aspergillus pseudoustus]|uniref:Uncharacterized protein n=1 Tax=Aspergillus pseudoustus TaxID=1810923 RepID=A0ABR4KJJ5_9EURO
MAFAFLFSINFLAYTQGYVRLGCQGCCLGNLREFISSPVLLLLRLHCSIWMREVVDFTKFIPPISLLLRFPIGISFAYRCARGCLSHAVSLCFFFFFFSFLLLPCWGLCMLDPFLVA